MAGFCPPGHRPPRAAVIRRRVYSAGMASRCPPQGLPDLRERIAMVLRGIGIAVDAGRILTTYGGTHAIDLVDADIQKVHHAYGTNGIITELDCIINEPEDLEPVFRFNLQPEPGHKFPAFVNLQQYYVEEYLYDRCLSEPLVELRFRNKVVAVTPGNDGVAVEVGDPAAMDVFVDGRLKGAMTAPTATVSSLAG